MMEARAFLLYDGHPNSPREMYETPDGLRFTPEQWMMMQFMDRIEKKLDEILARSRS